jgi:hypothetical protein
LSEAPQRDAKYEGKLSNISGHLSLSLSLSFFGSKESEIESLALRTSSAVLQLRFAQNDIREMLSSSFQQ